MKHYMPTTLLGKNDLFDPITPCIRELSTEEQERYLHNGNIWSLVLEGVEEVEKLKAVLIENGYEIKSVDTSEVMSTVMMGEYTLIGHGLQIKFISFFYIRMGEGKMIICLTKEQFENHLLKVVKKVNAEAELHFTSYLSLGEIKWLV